MPIEPVLEHYPKQIKLKDGLQCQLRLLEKSDARALSEFYLSLPGRELMFLKERVTDFSVIKSKCQHIDYNKELMLLAVHDKQIIGNCILHQQQAGWKRHIGWLNVHVHPQYRGRGLARTLLTEMISIARQCGLERLEAELIGEQEGAIKMFSLLGFSVLFRQPDYVKDMQAIPHEYILMGLKLGTDEEYAGMG